MKYKTILADVDGTLVEVGKDSPSPKVFKAIEQSNKAGVIFTIVTGRSLSLLSSLFDHFKTLDYVIFDNGAGIYHVPTKSVVWETTFDAATANTLLTFVKQFRPSSLGLATTKGRLRNVSCVSTDTHVRKLRLSAFNPENAKSIVQTINSKFSALLAVETSSLDKGLFDIYVTSAIATKQNAIVELSKILGVSTQEMIGIGDHYNDFPLLMACGLKVAMGNAVPELKEIADYIAPSVDEDGVADVIEKFILS